MSTVEPPHSTLSCLCTVLQVPQCSALQSIDDYSISQKPMGPNKDLGRRHKSRDASLLRLAYQGCSPLAAELFLTQPHLSNRRFWSQRRSPCNVDEPLVILALAIHTTKIGLSAPFLRGALGVVAESQALSPPSCTCSIWIAADLSGDYRNHGFKTMLRVAQRGNLYCEEAQGAALLRYL